MGVSLVLIPLALAIQGMVVTRGEKRQQQFVLKTRMKNRELLLSALRKTGVEPVEKDGIIRTAHGPDKQLSFHLNEENGYDVRFTGKWSLEEAEEWTTQLHEEYTLLLQEQVYRKLLERSKERGLDLETEEVEDDNSIVLTFTVREGP
jgi:hypothetical protein